MLLYPRGCLVPPQLAHDLLDAVNALLHLCAVAVREREPEEADIGLAAALRSGRELGRRSVERGRDGDVVAAGREEDLREGGMSATGRTRRGARERGKKR